MRYKVYKGENPFFVFVNNVEDLLANKGGWKKHFKTATERAAMKRAKKIVTTFMECIAEEMIMDNHAYLFPMENGAIMKIKETTDYNHRKYQYCMYTDGRYFMPVLQWMKPKYRHRYRVRFNYHWRRILFEVNRIDYHVKKSQVCVSSQHWADADQEP